MICQRIESSFVKYLLQNCTTEQVLSQSTDLAKQATEVVVLNDGLHASADFGQFTLNFYCGVSDEEIELPAVSVVCVSAEPDPLLPVVKTCDVIVSFQMQADSNSNTADVPEFLDAVSGWLNDVLTETNSIPAGLDAAEGSLVCSYMSHPDSSRSVDGDKRTRSVQHSFKIIASLK